MRRNIACWGLGLAIMFGSQPAFAQDQGITASEVHQALELLQRYTPDSGFEASAPSFDPSQPVVGFGFQIVDGDVRIARVMEGSAAEAAGLRVGMAIDRINGARLSTFSLEEIAKLIAAIDGELTFTIRDTGDVKLRKAPIEQQGS